MARDLNEKQKNLIDTFLNQVNEEQKWLVKSSFKDGARTQHFSKPKVQWKDLPTDTRDKIIKMKNFETIHTAAQCYIDERQSTELIYIDQGGWSESVSI